MDQGVRPLRAMSQNAPVSSKHLLTIAVEEYFHATALKSVVGERHWRRLESRVVENTHRALALLDEFGIKATFFVLGWVAERNPLLVAEIVSSGHEVACKSYLPRTIEQMSLDEFRDDVRCSRKAIETASGVEVLGYRIARGSFSLSNLWALDVLAEEGFVYDSSVYPRFRSISEQPWRRFPHTHRFGERQIAEFPLSSCGPDGFLIPAAGGNYMRQFPESLMQHAISHWDGKYASPFNMYFHVWELDAKLPRLTGASMLTRIRQYRNLEKMPNRLRYYFERYSFGSIRSKLGLQQNRLTDQDHSNAMRNSVIPSAVCDVRLPTTDTGKQCTNTSFGLRQQVTIVVPCFNEELVLNYLCGVLQELHHEFDQRYELFFVFVDDGSTDHTWRCLVDLFGNDPRCQLVRNSTNQGVAAAIMTGIRAAKTDVVCSIDCDCSYDPRQLESMIPLLTEDVSLVTASPYHALGTVLNVPEWRLFLSRTLSRMYRAVLHNKIATQTSCFRVYRRSKIASINISHGDFRGIAELLGRIDLQGGRIVEYPATLEARLLGYSKMKTLSTILGHIGLLLRFAWRRRVGAFLSPDRSSVAHTPLPLSDTSESCSALTR